MARMPDIEAEAWAAIRRDEKVVAGIWHRDQGEHPYAATETTATETTQEDDMSKRADDLRAFASRVEKFDDDVLDDVEAIQANPNTARVFAKLRTLTGISASPILDAAAGLLEAVPQPAAAPAVATTAPAQQEAAGQPA